MMLGREDCVLHTGFCSHACPLVCVDRPEIYVFGRVLPSPQATDCNVFGPK